MVFPHESAQAIYPTANLRCLKSSPCNLIRTLTTTPGGTDKAIDIDNPANLGQESTDAGTVKNLKWRFSDSKTRQLPGGWVREQVITDLPASHDIAGAQQHLTKNSIREMHWHRVAEWGYVYHGQVAVSAVDEDGRNQVEVLNEGDIWYFPKGEAHVIQGLADQNEYLLVFDDGDFEALGTSFNVDDWIAHTPKEILAKSLGEFSFCSSLFGIERQTDPISPSSELTVPNPGIDPSLLASVPSPNPYILKANSSADLTIGSPYGKLEGNRSYVFKASEIAAEEVPGGGGTVKTVDSRNFPVAKTIASSIVTLKPSALRELHWHPNVSLTMRIGLNPVRLHSMDHLLTSSVGRRMALLPLRLRSCYCLRRECKSSIHSFIHSFTHLPGPSPHLVKNKSISLPN